MIEYLAMQSQQNGYPLTVEDTFKKWFLQSHGLYFKCIPWIYEHLKHFKVYLFDFQVANVLGGTSVKKACSFSNRPLAIIYIGV